MFVSPKPTTNGDDDALENIYTTNRSGRWMKWYICMVPILNTKWQIVWCLLFGQNRKGLNYQSALKQGTCMRIQQGEVSCF